MKKRTLVCFLIFTLCVFYSSIPGTVFGQDADPTPKELAQQVYDKYNETLNRDDIKAVLPQALEGLKDPEVQGLLSPFAINLVVDNPSALATFGIDLDPQFIKLLEEDEALKTMLRDPIVQSLLQNPAAIDALAGLLDVGAPPPVEPTPPPVEPTPPPVEPTPPPVEPTPPPVEPTPPPVEPTPPPVEPTPPPVEPTPPPVEPTPPPVEVDTEGPINVVTSNLNGQSRLGGLSLNRIHGRAIIRELIAAAGLDANTADALVEPVVDFILAQVPQGFLPKKQIKQILTATQPSSIFQNEAAQLDFENFGNAITPALTELIYTNVPNVTKYLTSNNLNAYVRVPSALEGGNVTFRLNDRTVKTAKRITPAEFQADTIPYTFRLEETLAATNLPAWPDLSNQLFSGVVLRYSQTGLDGDYIAVDMDPVRGDKGVIWESEIGILPKGNTYYYFEVTLAEPVELEVINREAIAAALQSQDGTHSLDATRTYRIESWAMPDPRNLQLDDRGIFAALFTPDVAAEISAVAAPIVAGALTGQDVNLKIPGAQLRKLQNLLLRNANALTNEFERNFDPMLVSVFSVPNVDIASESLWYADIGSINDGPYSLDAVVYNADGEAVDHITVDFTTDTSAPEATINIGPANTDTTGYWNKDSVYVTTAPVEGTASLLNITSTPAGNGIGTGDGYLIYQIISLGESGIPESTWLPLTVGNSMLASDIWDLVKGQLEGQSNSQLQLAAGLNLDAVLGLLTPSTIQGFVNPFLSMSLGFELSEGQSALLSALIGAVVADLNMIPVTFDPARVMTMPIQGEQLPLLVGDYGIRAMGIDTLFNVGSHVAPTRLRVVIPEWDRSSITLASLGDLNGDGDADEPYESGTIFKNATDVTLTVTVDERTVHPGTIMVQYMDAEGTWQNISELELAEADVPAGTVLTLPWSVTDFDDLVMAGDTVELRTVTANGLQLTDESDVFTINLDADVHPVDPKVLVVDVDATSIVMTNPDSEAPQGTITLIGYTPRRTVPETQSILVEAKRANDEAWATIGTVEVSDPNGMDGVATAAIMFKDKTLGDVYPSVTSMIHIDSTSSYLKWSITVDTTMLEDTITKDSPGARDVSMDDNRYMVRANPVVDGDLPVNANENPTAEGEDYTEMFSVDNDDDVAPLGPTNIVATSIDAVEPIFVDNGDGTYTVGGLVDKYDPEVNSPVVTFTITPAAVRKTYASVKLLTTLPEGAIIGDITETAEGSGVFTVMIDVGTLMDDDEEDYNDRYIEDTYIVNPNEFVHNPKGGVFTFQLHALAYDKAMPYDDVTAADAMFLEYGNVQADDYEGDEITVNVENSYRPDPGVIAIGVVNSDGMTNPDSGAPQGELTFNVYTYYITSPPTEGIRVEVKRPIDGTWERITGTAVDPVPVDVSDVPGIADLADITGGLVGITQAGTLSGEESEVGIPTRYMKWTFIVDTRELALEDTVTAEGTIKLDDTIERGDASERDVSLDDNQYEVRAWSLTPKNLNQTEYLQRDGVEASFSLDNVDDVPPLGPTNITDVADVAGSITADEDGSYTVGGIVDLTVPSPVATFTIEPTAKLITYEGGSTILVQTAADGTVTETAGDLDEGTITIDVGLLENGTYMYHALTVDAFGNVQDDGSSPVITVHVLNFRVSDITELMVTAVDGVTVDGELPDRIPLRESIAVSFNVANGSLAVEDLTGILVDGHEVTFAAGSGAENAFSLMADKLSEVADGWYTPHGRVTKRNGSVTFALADINLDNTGPIITIETPTEGDTVNDLPTLLGAFHDGELGSGVSAENTTVVSLARLRPEEVVQDAVPIDVDQSMVEQDLASVVYTRTDKLAGGAYMFTIQVSDILGNIGEQTVTFAIEGINPTVIITAPASGQSFDQSPAEITGFFAGGGEVSITKFTINDADVTAEVDGNNFTYMLTEALGDGDYTVAVEVTDGSGLTAQTSLTFTVELPVPTVAIHSPHAAQVYDNGKPIIAGDFSGAEPIEVALSIDGEPVEPVVNDNNQFTFTPTEELSDGAHTVVAEVTDANGRTAKTSTDFTIDIPGPTVMIHVPDAGQMYDISRPVIQGEYSGVAAPVSLSLTLDGEVVPAIVGDNEFDYTPVDALDDGEYTLVAKVTDANGKTAEATAIFSIRLPVPTVVIHSPHAAQVYDNGKPIIAGDFSGAAPIAVTLSIDEVLVEAVVNDNNQFTYTPAGALSDGAHTVVAEVTDANGRTAKTTTDFTVDISGPTVAILSPAAGQEYEHGKPVVRGEFGGETDLEFTLTLEGEVVPATVVDNTFNYTPDPSLDDGEYTLVAKVADANGKSMDATVIFSVKLPVPTVAILTPAAGQILDHGQPVITGEFSGAAPIVVALSVDGEAVSAEVNANNQFTYTPADALSDGEHMISVMVTDANGRTAETTAVFTVDIPGPSVAIHAPAAGQMYDISKPVITGEFSGVAAPVSLSLTLNGEVVVAEVSGNEFTYTPADALDDGEYTLVAETTDANGKTADATAIFSIRLPVPTVAVQTPEAGQVYDHGKPVITGTLSGAAPIAVALSIDGKAVEAEVNDNNQFTYTPAEALSDGEHMIAVKVTDANGRTAETSAVFTVDIPGPSVAIHAPAAGQMYNISKPVITGEFSGVAAPVSLSLTLNGEAVVAEVSGNEFTYTPADALDDGEYTLVAETTDANGKTADATAIFSIRLPVPTVAVQTPEAGQVYDHGKPVITGTLSGAAPIAVALSIDGKAVEAEVNDNNQFTYTPAEALSDGEHMIAVKVTDANGRTAETSAVFTVDIPGPSVAIHAPAAGQMYDISKPVITGEFSGVAAPVSLSLTLNGEAVVAEVSGNEFTYTPADALDDGEYTLVAETTDANGKTADATAIFSIRLPVPTVAVQTPEAGQVYDHGKPVITGTLSGAAPIAVALSIDGKAVEAEVNDNNQFTYTPAEALSDGEHMIAVKVTDANGRTAETSAVFTVDIPGPSVAIHSPAAGQMYDHGKPVITGEFSGTAAVELTTLTINGEAAEATVEGNAFTYTPDPRLDDGEYTVIAEVTDANGKTAMATAVFSVRLPVPTVAVQTPEAGQVYDHGKPVITGDFSGAAPIVVKLSIDGKAVDAVVNDNNQFTYTPADALSDGGHTVAVEVTDANGRTAETSVVFTVDIPGPAVAILSPAPGQTYDDGKPVIRVEYSGMTDVEVTTFTVNGENVEVEPEDNQFAYTPANALETGEYHVVVEVTDENEKTAQAAVVFNVKIDNTPPVISEVSPSGVVKFNQQDVLDEKFGIILSAVITDEQSTISSVQFGIVDFGVTKRPLRSVSAQQIAEGKIEVTESFVPGTHTIRLIATSQGGTTEHSWRLTVEVDKDAPIISSITPAGTIHAGLPTISVSATDGSGVSEITIVVMDSNGEVVEGETQDDDEDRTNAGITRLDFNPEAPLSEGFYSIEVRATDTFGNSSTAKGGFSIDFDTAAPIITSSSPQNGARLMYKHDEEARPVISVTFGDAEAGVNVDSIRLVIESPKVGGGSQAQPINLSGEQMSATQVIYTPAAPAFPRGFEAPGQYTVTLEVSDNAHQEGNVSDESESARKANTAVYQFTFSVEYSDAPILNKPFNFPNPFKDTTRISFGLTRMSTVSIVIYDTTLRPVRTLRDNVVMPAGNYTGENGIGWDGKTSGGEDLARGIYYCHIIVTDGVEPEYVTLKLALTR